MLGFGASAVNPYLTYASIAELKRTQVLNGDYPVDKWIDRFNKATAKGILKIMSKIGISTLQSYQGAQIFEILGISREVVDKCFTGAVARIEGLGFDGIAEEVLVRHRLTFIQ